MKINCIKKAAMFLVVLTLGCAVVFAEPVPSPDSNSPVCKDKRPDANQHAHWFMQELSEKLNLTDAQKTAIKPILANDANEIKAVRQDSSLSEEQKIAKIKEIRENGRKQINAILTPEQQKEFAEIKSEARHRMREHAGDRLEVLAEKLNLTDAQKTAIKPIFTNDANEIKAVRQDSSLSEEQKIAKIEEIRENGRKQIDAILTPEQQKEFAEIRSEARHRMREHAGDRLEMLTKKLNLTDAQAAAIKPIFAAEANDIKAVWQDNSLSKEQKQGKMFDIRKAANEKINTILTPEQQAKWAELKEHARWMHHKGMHPEHKPFGQPPQAEQKPADSNS